MLLVLLNESSNWLVQVKQIIWLNQKTEYNVD